MTTIREHWRPWTWSCRKLSSGTRLCISHGENRFVMRKRSFQLFSLDSGAWRRIPRNGKSFQSKTVKQAKSSTIWPNLLVAHVNRDLELPAGNVSVISLHALRVKYGARAWSGIRLHILFRFHFYELTETTQKVLFTSHLLAHMCAPCSCNQQRLRSELIPHIVEFYLK